VPVINKVSAVSLLTLDNGAKALRVATIVVAVVMFIVLTVLSVIYVMRAYRHNRSRIRTENPAYSRDRVEYASISADDEASF